MLTMSCSQKKKLIDIGTPSNFSTMEGAAGAMAQALVNVLSKILEYSHVRQTVSLNFTVSLANQVIYQ